jgi:DNA repair photolyase
MITPQSPFDVMGHRRHRCGGTIWTVSFDQRGIGRAAFCGDRSRQARPIENLRDTGLIVRRLQDELWNKRGRRSLRWVWLSPNSDAFVPGARDLVESTLACARVLLEQGIGVVLHTRGGGPPSRGLVDLARAFPGMLRVDVGFFSSDVKLVRAWEAGCAPVGARLGLLESLAEAGAEVHARVGPIIPLINDEPRPLRRLARDLSRHGVHSLIPEWLEDAPGLSRQIEREVSKSRARIAQGWLHMEGAREGVGPRRIPEHVRRHGIARLHEASDAAGVALMVCRCASNLGTGACVSAPAGVTHRKQLDLFAESA